MPREPLLRADIAVAACRRLQRARGDACCRTPRGSRLLLALGWPLYVIGRRSSNALGIAMASGAMLVAQFSGVGLSALPEAGGLGFCLLGLAVGTSERAGRAPDLAAGLCFAVAADLRPDCAVWGGLLLMALVLGKKRGPLSVAAFAAGLFPYVIVVLTAGLGNVWESLVVDALRVPAERHVPLLVAGSLVLLVAGLLLLVTGHRSPRATPKTVPAASPRRAGPHCPVLALDTGISSAS